MITLTVNLPIHVALLQVRGVKADLQGRAFEGLLDCAADYEERFRGKAISEVPGVQAGRRLFRALNIEPTRHRPSSEALLRRALQMRSFSSINSLVDLCNWCALDFLLPIGGYDRKKISGEIMLRRGLAGESYYGLNNRVNNLTDRYVLADDQGAFGSPIVDSQRTAISLSTRDTLWVIFAPRDFSPGRLRQCAETALRRIVEYCGGQPLPARIISGLQPQPAGTSRSA